MMNPIAVGIAVRTISDVAGSARPDAPVVPDPPPRTSRVRMTVVALLRASARRRGRLADRLDPYARPIGQAG
jgi:hypothetical protein